ncbi:RNA polymerase subunit sigma [Streptomyces sp. NBC_01462]|uniref:RNA polymerase subunit sigma n=1 Tax=Streptomyces sp. NBC_01462 TaxID=2903876 RepID=UPI0032438795
MDPGETVPITELLDERRFLLDVAYWMLGSPAVAESVVDQTYRRWYELSDAERHRIAVPRSWLARTAGGICLDRLAPVGPGATDHKDDARRQPPSAEEEAGRVVLNVLESLPSAERATFVLRVFGMAKRTVADIVGRTEPETAELADRARRWLTVQRSRPTTPQQQEALARAVREACLTEDAERLASLLCPDVTAFFDGGGKVRTLTGQVHGSRQVADSLLTLLGRRPRTALTTHSVNGRTGLVARYGHHVAGVIGLDITDDHVAQVWVMLNPDKLRSWNEPHTHGGLFFDRIQ